MSTRGKTSYISPISQSPLPSVCSKGRKGGGGEKCKLLYKNLLQLFLFMPCATIGEEKKGGGGGGRTVRFQQREGTSQPRLHIGHPEGEGGKEGKRKGRGRDPASSADDRNYLLESLLRPYRKGGKKKARSRILQLQQTSSYNEQILTGDPKKKEREKKKGGKGSDRCRLCSPLWRTLKPATFL